MQLSDISPTMITAIGTALAGIITAICTYKAGKRKQLHDSEKQKHSIEQDAATSLLELNAANRAFRDEIRADLRIAQERIAVLEKSITAKDILIMTLQEEVQRLREELDTFRNQKV